MKRRSRLVLPVMIFAFALGGAADANATSYGPSAYLSFADSPFDGLGFSSFYLEDFEDGALDTPGVTASGGFVVGPGVARDSVDLDDGSINGFGTGGHSYYSNTLTSLTFTFDAQVLGDLPTHAGIVWTDVGLGGLPSVFYDDVVFEAFDALGSSLGTIGPVHVGNGHDTGETGEDRFFGYSHAGGISKITLYSANGSYDWEVDHLQYGVIPEPATCILLGSGLAAIGLMRRRANS